MPESFGRNPWPLAGGALALGLLMGYVLGGNDSPKVNPQLRALDANLWQHTSAEYRACCLQTYALVTLQLLKKLAEAPKEGKPLAVVMDLDETVLDNSAFQTALYRQGIPFSEESWRTWAKGFPEEVGLVPGALAFIKGAESRGVTMFYISNRDEEALREATLTSLGNLKIDLGGMDKRLFLATTTRDKTDRFESVKVL